MIVTLITLVILLISILFVKSVTITYRHSCGRRTKVNLLLIVITGVLAFVPVAKWIIMFGAPVVTILWYGTDRFEDSDVARMEIDRDSIFGKILLFKI